MFKVYKYKVNFSRHTLIKQKVTGINWEQLIDVLAKNSLYQVKNIEFHHPGCPNGTAQIDGGTMLTLWKEVEKKKTMKSVA
jgi:hypothetical protein